ncbi:MAG: LysR family transcriptional regulator [Burkholderiales bacterium]|nr:LysR family transcriptional regulator [Burkholderiales bacterium]
MAGSLLIASTQINNRSLATLFGMNEQMSTRVGAADVEAMALFARVAELGSFTQAAAHMGVSKATATAAVQRLEAALGTRLLHRTTRRVELTQDGRVFHERCRDLLADREELRTLFRAPGDGALSGRLRVDMPMGAARHLLVPRLPEFLQAHPQLELELSSTDRRVDVVREGFDCVLRVGRVDDSSLVARPLGRYRVINCASPGYLARHGVPQRPEDLAQHRLVDYVQTLGGRSPGFEIASDDDPAGAPPRFVRMPVALVVNNSEAYLAACLAGLGLIQVPGPGVEALLEAGRLVEVMPAHRAAPMPVTLLYPHRRHLPLRVRVFMDWVAGVMAEHLDDPSG